MELSVVKSPVEEYLNNVSYAVDPDYVPQAFSLEFVNFIKLVNGEAGEENLTPVLHYTMIDDLASRKKKHANMLFRGSAKTTLFGEYFFLYLGVYGHLPVFGKVDWAIYVSDSIENGVKNMRINLEYRWQNSEFLQHYIPHTRFTDIRWEFTNLDGEVFTVKGYGAKTGVRGSKVRGKRPSIALLDDLISDEDARSATVIASVEDTVGKAVNYALHPTRKKVIWNGTPFNSRDPLYKAIESGVWSTNVFPVCEVFPCTKEEFKGAWEDRFPYEYVRSEYDDAVEEGKVDHFNQELMLRIMSEEDRLIQDSDINWYSRKTLLDNKAAFNFYITTDFATSKEAAADFSIIAVWAYNNNGDWFWVDGIVKRQLMDKNIDDLFMYAQMYNPQSVGVEISGQQKGFISWIQSEMMTRNIWFTLATDSKGSDPGLRPTTDKMKRFNIVVPWFKMGKMFFPLEKKKEPEMLECMSELSLAAVNGFRSKHDDFIDAISMLSSLKTWRPSQEGTPKKHKDNMAPTTKAAKDLWEFPFDEAEEGLSIDSYIV